MPDMPEELHGEVQERKNEKKAVDLPGLRERDAGGAVLFMEVRV